MLTGVKEEQAALTALHDVDFGAVYIPKQTHACELVSEMHM